MAWDNTPDYAGKRGEAERLAKKIRTYWHNIGYLWVKVWVEQRQGNPRDTVNGVRQMWFDIRSNVIPTNPIQMAPDKNRAIGVY